MIYPMVKIRALVRRSVAPWAAQRRAVGGAPFHESDMQSA
jgi:hypothetical protein